MNARKRVAWNLRRLRIAKGLPQEALAVDAIVDRTYVSRIERCQDNPSIDILERIAKALGADISDFFRIPLKGEKPPEVLRRGRKPLSSTRNKSNSKR